MAETKAAENKVNSRRAVLIRVVCIVLIYCLLRYLGGDIGRTILYPLTLLVTFLHEFGHGAAAMLTGGSVRGMQINTNGSGHCVTAGGNLGTILIGGYVGSIILGNILFYIGARLPWLHRITMAGLGVLMAFAAIFWYETPVTTAILLGFGGLLFFLAQRADWPGEALMFFGIASLLYIVEDSRVGPSSDMAKYADLVGFFGTSGWTTIWMIVVLAITVFNVYLILTPNPIRRLVTGRK
jgi:Peptidase M50B-like